MSQTLLTPTIITRKALMAFVNSLTFAKGVNRQYDSQFANSGASPSGKIGPTLTIRKPNRFAVSTGAALQVQEIAEESTTFTVSTRKHVDFTFPTQDLTLTVDDFMDRYVNRAVETLANEVDYDGLSLWKDVPNQVGTYGTIPGATADPNQLKVYFEARQKLNENACPKSGERYCCINPAAEAAGANSMIKLFNPSALLSKQFETGEMGSFAGARFKMDQNVNNTGTLGDRVAATGTNTIKTTATSGNSTIVMTVSSGTTFTVGDVFTVAGVYAVNPQSKRSTGSLKQFVVLTQTTTTTTATLTVYPAPVLTGPTQNVNRLPTASDAVVTYGTAAGNYDLNMMYHQDAFSLVTADLEIPQGVHFAARENYEGISMRIVRQYSIDSDQIPCRIDVLYGWKTLYPEWACRIAS